MVDTELWEIYDSLKKEKSKNISYEGRKSKEICQKCKSSEDKLVIKEGHLVCTKCGLINRPQLSTVSEWRYYGNKDNRYATDPTRCGMPINPLLPKSSFRTYINGIGNEIFRKYHTWNNTAYDEKRLMEIFRMLTKKIKENSLPSPVLDRSKWLYSKYNTENLIRGVNVKSLIAAIVYYASKDKGYPLTTKEVAKMFDVKHRDLANGCKRFVKNVYFHDPNLLKRIQPTSVRDYIFKICHEMQATQYIDECTDYVNIMQQMGITISFSDISLAYGVLFYILQNKENKKFDKNVSISKGTINKVKTLLKKYHHVILLAKECL